MYTAGNFVNNYFVNSAVTMGNNTPSGTGNLFPKSKVITQKAFLIV